MNFQGAGMAKEGTEEDDDNFMEKTPESFTSDFVAAAKNSLTQNFDPLVRGVLTRAIKELSDASMVLDAPISVEQYLIKHMPAD